MIPNKIYWFLGYNNLAFILEQERKHWLLKSDKKKQLQDKKTGDIFQGQIDNTGCDIILESEKLPIKNNIVQLLTFANPAFDKILDIDYSAFTYSSGVNGFMFARITSINFPLSTNGGDVDYKNYKLKLKNCEECIIPFGGSVNSSDVFVDKWLKTSTPPTIMMLGDDGTYSIEKTVEFNSEITNVTYYYPLTETLQPLDIIGDGTGTYITNAVNDNGLIGYPLFWFTCDQSNVGPTLKIMNNTNDRGEQLMFIGNEGNASKYMAKLYVGVDGNLNATPDGTETSNYVITCKCKNGYSFNNATSDFDVAINPSSITMENTSTLQTYPFVIMSSSEKDVITMSKDLPWEYIDDSTYSINMNTFDSNCMNVSQSPLTSIFDVHFDESIPFLNETSDIGFAGIRMGSSNLSSDVYPRYPHELNKWDGLPEWVNNMEDGETPQHMAIYAIHNTPTYSPDIPESRQVAALLLDPGKVKTDDTNSELSNDERGRVYVLSNDEAEYKNNANETYPKPARTVARICDIPTSVIQLSGISGLAPTSIVDKKYVRTEASFDIEDKDRLYNTLASRWVKPTALDSSGVAISERTNQSNDYVFDNQILLNAVDLINHNDFREHTNLNPMVDVQKVQLASITEPGSGYAIGDIGEIIVGGFAFNYTVTEINEEDGGVKNLVVTPSSDYEINLSNFDMTDGNYGISESYGTSPRTGSGTGLKFRFRIVDYDEILPSYGEIYDDLFALVRFKDGLYLYSYVINERSSSVPKVGTWTSVLKISEYEQSTIVQSAGGLSTSEAYMNSIIPTLKDVRINLQSNNMDPVTVTALTTPSFVNIVDKTKTPIQPISADNNDEMVHVDMCKFYCSGMNRMKAMSKNVNSVISMLKSNNVFKYDSYVIWKWDQPASSSNLYFTYGVIQRSFNNFLSTDYTTTLPSNDLNCDDYVHSNSGTTVVWDVNDFGVMMWTYNPKYQKREIYNINPETRDLYIERNDMSWSDIDVRDSRAGTSINIVDSFGRLNYNILTNNPIQAAPLDPDMTDPDPIYQQPNFVQIPDLTIGNAVSAINKNHQPMGNWQLVFPRVQSFKLTNITNGREFTPVQLQMIKGTNLGDIANVVDELGHNVNAKTLLIDEVDEGINAKLYNPESGNWDII